MTKENLCNWGINTFDFNLKLLYQFLITVYHVRRKRSKSDSAKVIDQSKSSARVHRSVAVYGVYLHSWRCYLQFVYGQFGDNSKLERNAIRLMPNGQSGV
jgi:hypothetical protein